MRGYLCDGACGGFFRTAPAANYEHNAWVTDPDEGKVRRITLDAQFCDDCAIELTQRFRLYDQHEVEAALHDDDEARR